MDESIKQQKLREEAVNRIQAVANKEINAKQDLKPKDTGAPLVVNPNTK